MDSVESGRLADADPAHGRIGYGRISRYSPLLLGLLLLLALGLVYWFGRDRPSAPPTGLSGEPAPDVTLTPLDGTPLRLADLRGSVVVLNFWGSRCKPCRDEMPVFQGYADEAARRGERTAGVGVGVRTDQDVAARDLVEELGLTGPIGRDTATEEPGVGPIAADQLAFSIERTRAAT